MSLSLSSSSISFLWFSFLFPLDNVFLCSNCSYCICICFRFNVFVVDFVLDVLVIFLLLLLILLLSLFVMSLILVIIIILMFFFLLSPLLLLLSLSFKYVLQQIRVYCIQYISLLPFLTGCPWTKGLMVPVGCRH